MTSLFWVGPSRLTAIATAVLAATLGIPAAATAATAHGLGPPNTWVATGEMTAARSGQTATTLRNGEVLVAGGGNASADLYNPATRTFSATGRMPVSVAGATATLLPSGKVLVAGGRHGGRQVANAELYNPAIGTWSATGPMKRAGPGRPRPCCPTVRCWWPAGLQRQRRRLQPRQLPVHPVQRRAVQPGHRDLAAHRRDGHRPPVPDGDPAAGRRGAGGGRPHQLRRGRLYRHQHRGAVPPGHREVDRHGLDAHGPRTGHRHPPAGRRRARGRRAHPGRLRLRRGQLQGRRALPPGDGHMDPHRVDGAAA